jgi:hypothetical protein
MVEEQGHNQKAPPPMLPTESEIITDAKLVQLLKAKPPMLETESGITTDTKLAQSLKA